MFNIIGPLPLKSTLVSNSTPWLATPLLSPETLSPEMSIGSTSGTKGSSACRNYHYIVIFIIVNINIGISHQKKIMAKISS